MDYHFQSKIKPISTTANQKANSCKMITNKTVNSTNSLVKPRQISTLNPPSNQARPTSPKISKKTNNSVLIQPSQTNFVTSRIKPSSANQLKSSSLKKPTTTYNQTTSALTKPLTVNSSVNRLNNQPQSNSRNGSSTNLKSSLNSLKSKEIKKKDTIKESINNSSFVPRETLVKLTKKHEELTNKFNFSSQVINKNQLAVDALSCLVNYMAIDLDAFENPNLKKRIDQLECVEKELQLNVTNLKADNNKLDNELQFEKHRSHKEKENLLTMFELEMKTVEKNYQENIKIEQTKRDKAEKDLLYLKQNLSKDKKIDFLNKEIESLKTVLDLKEKEIKDLRYKLDRTFVDQDEISQLKNERDNLSLAKEQLEYSLNQKNEELKFVLQENTSLASLSSLTSTPLPVNDRNNNSIVKKRKNLAKKQKLDVNESNYNNKNDDHLFVKPTISMNLHRERFVRPSVDLEMNKNDDNDYFQEEHNNLKQHEEDKIFENNSNDKLFTDNLFNENNDKSFNDNDKFKFDDYKLDDEIDFIKPLIDRPTHKKSLEESVLKNLAKQQSDSIDNSFNQQLNNSYNKEMEISLYKSFDDKSLELDKSNHFNSNSFNHSNQHNSQHNSNHFTESNFNNSTHHHLSNSFTGKSPSSEEDKQFNIDDIKERCFKARIERESPNKINQIKETNDDKFKRPFDILDNYPKDNFVTIKTCQIISDENEISIIKNNNRNRPESSSVLDSGFCDL